MLTDKLIDVYYWKWFHIWWYQYLFEKPFDLRRLFCRMGNHKCGPVYYNTCGLEPNMRCQNCGDYIG